MKLENTFTVPVGADAAWRVLLDVERIAPCMPGATLTGKDGDSFTGNVKVKVGPISLTYGGTARFASVDEEHHVAVIEAAGKETRGSGTAKAIITARMQENEGSTSVAVETDLTITGKPAQFGRGVMTEISGKLITQFADCLAAEIAGSADDEHSGSEPAGDRSPTPDTGERAAGGEPAPAPKVAGPTPEAIDLLDAAGVPVLKRIGPWVAALAALFVLLAVRRRRH